jgi:exonuclease III
MKLNQKYRTASSYDKKGKGFEIKDLRIGTWNTQGMSHKTDELLLEFTNTTNNIGILSETKKKNKDSQGVGKYLMIYSGVSNGESAAAGVAVMIKKN